MPTSRSPASAHVVSGPPPVVLSPPERLFVPTPTRPVRARMSRFAAHAQVAPHSHPWAQVAMADRGVIRLAVDGGSYLVPPSHALWIPPGMVHAVTMVDAADLRTLYLHVPHGRYGPGAAPLAQADAWRGTRMLEVSPLLRALVQELPIRADGEGGALSVAERSRERHLLLRPSEVISDFNTYPMVKDQFLQTSAGRIYKRPDPPRAGHRHDPLPRCGPAAR